MNHEEIACHRHASQSSWRPRRHSSQRHFVRLFYHLTLRKVTMYGKMPCLQERQLDFVPPGIIARKDIVRKWLSAQTAVKQPPSVIIAHSPNAPPTARSNRTCKRRS